MHTLNKSNKNANPSQNTNLIETFTSTKNKTANVLDSLFKKIHYLEFVPKSNLNSVEYYLNNFLKNKRMNNQDIGSRINSIVIPQFGNSTINNLNNNTLVNIISQVEDEIPYNISEHQMPLSDEDNIIKILKSKDYFQDQSNEILSLILGEIIYISF